MRKHHIFHFNGKLYKQVQGGAIGVGLAGEVANLFMVWWDRQLKQKLTERNIMPVMYSRYVDDVDLVAKGMDPESMENEKQTMETIQVIANSVHPSIRVTIDYPSKHENKRMAVLDVEQWIDIISIDGHQKPQILNSHYMKRMSNRKVISKSSALSYTTKINVLVADLVRIMRNVSPLLDKTERTSHVQYFIKRMQLSGYNINDRLKVYNLAKARYNKIIKEDQDGLVPMYSSVLNKRPAPLINLGKKFHPQRSLFGPPRLLFFDN